MMNRRRWMLDIVRLAFAVLVVFCRSDAQTTVSISPSVASSLPGRTVDLNVVVSNVTNLHLYHVIVYFDNTILRCNGVSNGGFFPGIFFFHSPATFPSDTASFVTVDDALGGTQANSGSGTLFSIRFTALRPGSTSISLVEVVLRNHENQSISHSTANGSVTVEIPTYEVQEAWNLLSIPLRVANGSKLLLFPTSVSDAYGFDMTSGYVIRDTLLNGVGYWLKFPSQQDIPINGVWIPKDTIEVVAGWNMIGTISDTLPISAIEQIPSGIVTSDFYGYATATGYVTTLSLIPSKGYWVKTSSSGVLIMTSGSFLSREVSFPPEVIERAASLRFADARESSQDLFFTSEAVEQRELDRYELPPVPPAGVFDARFATNRRLENVEAGNERKSPIRISSAQYPLSILWDLKNQVVSASLVIGEREIQLGGTGSIAIADPAVSIALKLGEHLSLPQEFSLWQNYPNPFNPSTTIKYDLPVESHVLLKVFNVLGQEVATLVDENQKAGYQSVEWNASIVASGVYFCQLSAGPFISMKRMLLLK